MRRRSTPCFVALLAATVLVSGGCGRAAPDRVATINGEPVTGKEFDAFLSAKLGEFSREPLADSVKSQLFDDFVKRRVTIQEARQRGLSVTHEAPTPTSVKEPIRAEIASDLLVAKYYRAVVLRGVTGSAQEVADYYETHRADYSRPNGYYVREFRASTREEAERWRSRIASNAQTARPAEPARAGDPAERRGSLSFYEQVNFHTSSNARSNRSRSVRLVPWSPRASDFMSSGSRAARRRFRSNESATRSLPSSERGRTIDSSGRTLSGSSAGRTSTSFPRIFVFSMRGDFLSRNPWPVRDGFEQARDQTRTTDYG
jgi:hypothetical protein